MFTAGATMQAAIIFLWVVMSNVLTFIRKALVNFEFGIAQVNIFVFIRKDSNVEYTQITS